MSGMSEKRLAVVDSGYGGISILNSLYQAKNGRLQALCFADQKNVPYGNRQSEEIIAIMSKNVKWLQNQGINEVLLACNTTSAVALEQLRLDFPQISFTGIIDMTSSLLENQELERVLVLATAATIKSQAYRYSLMKFKAAKEIVEKALPELVDLIESLASEKAIYNYLKRELAEYKKAFSAIILGCTHYALVKDMIKEICQCERIIDSNMAVYDFAAGLPNKQEQVVIYTSGDAAVLKKQQYKLFGTDFQVEHVDL